MDLALFSVILTIATLQIGATPIEHDFTDNWNYIIKSNDEPLLGNISIAHNLPPPKSQEPEKRSFEPLVLTRSQKKMISPIREVISCSTCILGVTLLQTAYKAGRPLGEIREEVAELCVMLEVANRVVCTGMFDIYGSVIVPILKHLTISPSQMCQLVLGEVCEKTDIPGFEWTVPLPEVPKPQAQKIDLPKTGVPTFKVLQISDTHYDPEYNVGSPGNCEEPLCCRSYSTPKKEKDPKPAGKWGSYNKCDSPKILIDNMLTNIREKHPDIDYILWTGDLPPHDIWNQTKEGNLDIIQEAVEQMIEHFPNTPIFPAIGNHESLPAGNFAPPWVTEPEQSIDWLYSKTAQYWSKWLPEGTNDTLLHGGFYSILLRPGFRLISVNTNYCHSLSWWLLLNSTDPAHELQWLVDQLQEAENRHEKVHIIGHIPPGSNDCMETWSRNFNAIIERYENTVVAQFYGHSHADEFEVLYDLRNETHKRPIGVAYLGPSVTTYENNNPGYRIYYVDGDHNETTREVIDFETWTMNLEEANNNDKEPVWYPLYSARKDLGLTSLRPQNWDDLIIRMAKDRTLFELFHKLYYRDGPERPKCDKTCTLQILCDLRSGRSHARRELCGDLEVYLDSQ